MDDYDPREADKVDHEMMVISLDDIADLTARLVGFLKARTISIAIEDRDFQRLRDEAMGQYLSLYPMEPQFEFDREKQSASAPPSVVFVNGAMQPPLLATERGVRLTELFAKYKGWSGAEPASLDEWERGVKRFIDVHGNMYVREITANHIDEFMTTLRRYPRGLTKDMQDQPVAKVIEIANKREHQTGKPVNRIGTATIEKYRAGLGAIFSHGLPPRNIVFFNPAKGLTPDAETAKKKIRKAKPRLSYDDNDVTTIFNSPVYRGQQSKGRRSEPGSVTIRDHCFWLSLLAIFTGARLEKIGQLLCDDVRREDEIDFFWIQTIDDEEQSIKSGSARRRVPIHPMLVQIGFMSYLEERRYKHDRRLFPGLTTSPNGNRTKAFSQWWGRYNHAIGITDPKKVFHSFRHTFVDAAKRGKVPREIRKSLVGHSLGDVHDGYGSEDSIERLAEEIAKVTYCVDLSHLCSH